MVLNERFIRTHTGLNIRFVDTCGSAFDEIGKYDVVIAQKQENGIGRGDHTFYSPEGGLYIVMRVQGVYINQHTLTPAVGMAVHDAIQSVLGLDTKLKWVNDIMYFDKKVGGILCKCVRKAEYLIGIGINYSTTQEQLDEAGLGDVATTLEAPELRVSAFITGLISLIRRATIATFDNERYSRMCLNVGRTVEFMHNGVSVRGYAEQINPDGSLSVRIGNATVAVDAGEVLILRNVDGAVILDDDDRI